MYPGQIPMPSSTALRGDRLASLGTAAAGRPPRIQPVILTPANTPTGYAMPAVTPDVVQQAQQKYLTSGQLPPQLRPKSADVLERRRHQAITRGWQVNTNSPYSRSLRQRPPA